MAVGGIRLASSGVGQVLDLAMESWLGTRFAWFHSRRCSTAAQAISGAHANAMSIFPLRAVWFAIVPGLFVIGALLACAQAAGMPPDSGASSAATSASAAAR